MSLKNKSTIFESVSQLLDVDPSTIRLTQDRLLLRELEPEETVGSILIPESARGKSRYRWGIVVATGPGNLFLEAGISDDGFVRRRMISDGPCRECSDGYLFSLLRYEAVECPACYGTGKQPRRVPTTCQVGDKVLFDQRKEAQFFINGESHFLVFEEQAVAGVWEQQWRCTWCHAPSHEPAPDEYVVCPKCGTAGCESLRLSGYSTCASQPGATKSAGQSPRKPPTR